jgi:hypothetical protein
MPRRGRPVGSVTRASLTMREICSKLKFDPSKELLKIFNQPDTPRAERIKIATDLMPYLHAKISAVQIDLGSAVDVASKMSELMASRARTKNRGTHTEKEK